MAEGPASGQWLGARLLAAIYRLVRGRHVLFWLTLALVPAFSLTALVTEVHRTEHRTLALAWEARGEAALGDGRPDDAVEAFRNALRFARDDRTLRLRLADSLAGAGRGTEARAYLLGLWQEQPGNARVNLGLARLAAADENVEEASRYYQNAIQGAWADDAGGRRRAARLELAEFLVAHARSARAEVELIALAADLPPETAMRRRVAALLSAAGAHRRALELFQTVLETDPQDVDALGGAGRAALALGDHAAVVRYLRRVPAADAGAELSASLETSRQMLAIDPYQRGLSSRERAARARRVLERAGARLEACDEGLDLDPLRESVAEALRTETPVALARDPERLDAVVALGLRAHAATETGCGALTPLDRALLLLAAQLPEAAA